MSIAEIICIVLLSFFIVSCIVVFILDWRLGKIEAERDRKIDNILHYVELEMNDRVFPEFEDGNEKHKNDN